MPRYADRETPSWAIAAYADALARVTALARRRGRDFLHLTHDGVWDKEMAWWWTSGFWPGMIRLVLNDVPDAELEDIAKSQEDRLYALLDHPDFFEIHHDVGFQFQPTSVHRYQQTGDPQGLVRGCVAATLLMGRLNVAGGVSEAWNADDRRGFSIIDTMMNLPLLFWAAAERIEPRFRNCAVMHLDRAIREFVRDDHSVHHVVEFDQKTGVRICAHGGQGFGPDSAWSRGQGWAIYGLAIAARYTGQEGYRDTARKIADRFLVLSEGHEIVPWDFRADNAADGPRDSSATAIAACGLLELAKLGDAVAYDQAEAMLLGLDTHCGTRGMDGEEALLRLGTSNLPKGQGVNCGLIYGDYFYFEALQRLNNIDGACW